jgi:hypothetical protein
MLLPAEGQTLCRDQVIPAEPYRVIEMLPKKVERAICHILIHGLRVEPVGGREGPEEPGVLYETFRGGEKGVAFPVEDAVKAAMFGIWAMLGPESHDLIGQVVGISVLGLDYFCDVVVQLLIPSSQFLPDGKVVVVRLEYH